MFRWSDLRTFSIAKQIENTAWATEKCVHPKRQYHVIELFAGAGGLALGLEKAGFSSVLLNEIDSDACESLKTNRPHWNVVKGDVSKLDFSEFDGIDVVSGGFPCQAFSYAGNRAGFEDARGTLFFEFARAIRETRPKVFLGENVRGLLTHDNGRTLNVIRSIIHDLGYTLVEPRILKAIFYEVPQKRERLALVGIRNDLAMYLPAFKWPDPAPRVFTVRDALYAGSLYAEDVPDSSGVAYTKWRAEIIDHVPPGGYWRDLPLELQKKLLKGSFDLPGGKTGIGRRLSWDEPSLTLTCAPAQNQTGRCHPAVTRPLTVREYARIQTFPDTWQFCGSIASQYRQIGNAVPVNLATALCRRLVALLNMMESNEVEISQSIRIEGEISRSLGLRKERKLLQLQLLELSSLYVIGEAPLTLLGTYRQSCRAWIIDNNLYNYPISEKQLDDTPELLSVRRLVLRRRSDSPLHFKVKGYSIVAKAELKILGYNVGNRHPASQRYLLYKLEPLSTGQTRIHIEQA